MGKRILVHVCCGPCATSSIERLLSEGYEPVLFFSDSNIFPEEEFMKRYENLLIVARLNGLEVILDEWDHSRWLEAVKGHEEDREHGERCLICFRFNLARTAEKARVRFKPSAAIFRIGDDYPGFQKIDFKKKDGFNRSVMLSKELSLYRQDYCGCEFSLRDRR